MDYRLFIDGIEIDLGQSNRIVQTKQVNTIGRLNDRQSNFVPKFNVPLSSWNLKVFQFLGIPNNTSNVPYIKSTTDLFIGNLTQIKNGWATIKSTGKSYELYIYDGVIDFYKDIENKVLTDAGLSELNHLKNLANIIGTWTDLTLPYRYNIADYNGSMIYDTDKINIDYLIPQANVKYLWDKVFTYLGWTYEGSVFNLEEFENLWLTYPKAIGNDSQVTTNITQWHFTDGKYAGGTIFQWRNYLTNNPVINNSYFSSSNEPGLEGMILTCLTAGFYKFTFDGNIGQETGGVPEYDSTYDIILVKSVPGGYEQIEMVTGITQFQDFEAVFYINLQPGDQIQITPNHPGAFLYATNAYKMVGDLYIDLDIVTGNQIDFEEAFISFSIKDFINMILFRFSLTPFIDNVTKTILFLTHEQWLQTDQIDDWSDKFSEQLSEKYILANYARENWMRYKYNDSEANYNDGKIFVDNINLKDKTTLVASKVYSPEKNKVDILGVAYNVYPLWNKEIQEDSSIKYKELENRFYLMRSIVKQSSITLGSDVFQTTQAATVHCVESFELLSFADVISRYYTPIYSILRNAKIVVANIFLTPYDIMTNDFKKLAYIKQLGGYFIKNKIINFVQGKLTRCELIRVELGNEDSGETPAIPQIIIDADAIEPDGISFFVWRIFTQYQFLNYTPTAATLKAKQLDAAPADGGVYTGHEYSTAVTLSSDNHTFNLPVTITTEWGWYEVQITDDISGLQSNIDYVYVNEPAPENDPAILVTVENPPGTDLNVPFFRDVQYRFFNFTPTSATLRIQAKNFLTGAYAGPPNTINLTTLTADTWHTLVDVEFSNGLYYYEIELVTDTISYIVNAFVF